MSRLIALYPGQRVVCVDACRKNAATTMIKRLRRGTVYTIKEIFPAFRGLVDTAPDCLIGVTLEEIDFEYGFRATRFEPV